MLSLHSAWANRPVRAVLRWQAILTGIAAVLGAYFAGLHGVLSATAGGAISIVAAVLFASIASVRRGISADDVLITAFKAEGAKLVFIVIALWLVMAAYKNVVHVFLIGTFIATVLVSSMAFFVGDKRN
jgi:F0F1-type ATP synthase assembly protein I